MRQYHRLGLESAIQWHLRCWVLVETTSFMHADNRWWQKKELAAIQPSRKHSFETICLWGCCDYAVAVGEQTPIADYKSKPEEFVKWDANKTPPDTVLAPQPKGTLTSESSDR